MGPNGDSGTAFSHDDSKDSQYSDDDGD